MSEATDNLLFGISEEATPEQAGSEDTGSAISQEATAGESVDGLKARLATLEAELGKKNKQIENANKLIGRKVVNSEDLQKLGITQEQAQEVATAAQGMSRQEAQQTAQAIGGNELENWFVQAEAKVGKAGAIQAMLNAYLPQMISQHLSPLNEQLSTARDRVNQVAIKSAVHRLGEEFGDVEDKAEAIKAYWKANPKKYQQLIDSTTDEEEKYDLLETVYLKVSRSMASNSTAASKAAGAVEAKQREQMKNSSVTSGSGARSSKEQGEKTLADSWLEEMTQHDKASKLFG